MYFENIKNGPSYFVVHKEDAEKKDFGDYLRGELEKPVYSILGAVLSFFVVSLVSLLFLIPPFVFLNDFITLIFTSNSLKQFSETYSSTIQIIYFIRLVFSLISGSLILWIYLGTMREILNHWLPQQLRMDVKRDLRYFTSFYEFLRQDDPDKLKSFVLYSEKDEKFRLNGYFSSLDPLRTFNAFEEYTMKYYSGLLLGAVWVGFTAMITYLSYPLFTLDSISGGLIRLISLFIILLMLLFIPVYLFSIIKIWFRFQKFVRELMTRQEECASYLLVQYEKKPTTENRFLLEREEAKLIEIRSYTSLLSPRLITISLPIMSAIPTIIATVSSL